jgi:hypothetical protein
MRAIALATATSVALVLVYLALGGASYAPAKPTDPCAARDWREPHGLQAVAEQIVLSGIDGAACRLGTSREDVVLAFGSRSSLERFGREHDVTPEELERLVRAGIDRAIDDAVAADALNPSVARLIRGVASRIPVGDVIDLLDRLLGS